ncbi:MAG: sugar ABC transporter permease [Chloroflexi bacterium]|nr:sugar ABC transporter permease [Chloroflexota bacterium]
MDSQEVPISKGRAATPRKGVADNLARHWGLRKRLFFRRDLYGALFVAPAMIFFLVFNLYPMVNGFYLSLTRYTLLKPPRFIGLDNFIGLASDARFINGVKVTTLFVLGTTVPKWVLSLALALLFKGEFKFREVYKVLYFIPALLSGVVVSLVWKLLFDPLGLVNAFVEPMVGKSEIFWLADPKLAPVALMIVDNWAGIGFFMLIWLAGLAGIPSDFYDAAAIDGANRWQSFWHITLPLLKPTTIFVMVISMINSFQSFSLQFVMTEGGPNDATSTIALLVYNYGFRYFKMGQAAAMSIFMFVVIITLTLTQMRLMRAEETSYM